MTPQNPDSPQNPYGDEETATIVALQAAGGTGVWTGMPTAELARRGDRARRRRHVLQAGGGLTGVAAVVALALTLGPIHSAGSDVVPADGVVPPTASPSAAPSIGPVPDHKSVLISSAADRQVLLAALGPDFHLVTHPAGQSYISHGAIELTPGSPSAQGLPAGYGAAADIQVLSTRPAGVSAADDPSDLPPLSELCAQGQEKGGIDSACTPVTLPDGRIVQVQHGTLTQGNYKTYGGRQQPGSTDSTTVYFQRQDDSVVRLYLSAYDTPAASSAARQKQAAAWLPQWTTALENVAADPRIGPTPGPATEHPAPTAAQLLQQQELALLQQNLGNAFALIDGTVELEPGSKLEGQLPDRRYGATATLAHLDSGDLQTACGADLSGCGTLTLPDGTKAYTSITAQPWAATTQTATPAPGSTVIPDPPGSAGFAWRTTVYQPQADGQVVATIVDLTTNVPFTSTEKTGQTPADKAWLKALQVPLAKAAEAIGHLDSNQASTS